LTLGVVQQREDLERQSAPSLVERRGPLRDNSCGGGDVLVGRGLVPELQLEVAPGLPERPGEGAQLAAHVSNEDIVDLAPLVTAQIEVVKSPPGHTEGRIRRTSRPTRASRTARAAERSPRSVG